jgi:methyl-accepting chemotaxis protein
LVAAVVVIASTAAALALGACGGDGSEDEYKDDFRPFNERLVGLGQQVGDTIEGAGESTDQQLADDFDDFAQQLGDLRGELEDLDPPDDLDEEHDELVEVMGEVRGSVEDIAKAADEQDPDAARTATEELVQQSSELRDVRERLAREVREF